MMYQNFVKHFPILEKNCTKISNLEKNTYVEVTVVLPVNFKAN